MIEVAVFGRVQRGAIYSPNMNYRRSRRESGTEETMCVDYLEPIPEDHMK